VEVNLFRQIRVLRELALALGGGIAFLVLFLIVLQWLDGRLTWEFWVTIGQIALALALLLTVLAGVGMWIMGGRAYPYVYTLNTEGIRVAVAPRQRRRNALLYELLFILGVLGGPPSAIGAALLGSAREVEFIRWKDIRRVEVDRKAHCVLLRHGWKRTLIWFLPERFSELSQLLEQHLAEAKRGS